MTHRIEYFAAKARKLSSELDSKRDELLKRDRELRELSDEIDALKANMAELEAEAASNGHAVSDLHAAANAANDEQPKKRVAK